MECFSGAAKIISWLGKVVYSKNNLQWFVIVVSVWKPDLSFKNGNLLTFHQIFLGEIWKFGCPFRWLNRCSGAIFTLCYWKGTPPFWSACSWWCCLHSPHWYMLMAAEHSSSLEDHPLAALLWPSHRAWDHEHGLPRVGAVHLLGTSWQQQTLP